jgi:hypothetical protein
MEDIKTSPVALLVSEACNIGYTPVIDAEDEALTRARLVHVDQYYLRVDDNASYSDMVFGLFTMLGYNFSPRFPALKRAVELFQQAHHVRVAVHRPDWEVRVVEHRPPPGRRHQLAVDLSRQQRLVLHSGAATARAASARQPAPGARPMRPRAPSIPRAGSGTDAPCCPGRPVARGPPPRPRRPRADRRLAGPVKVPRCRRWSSSRSLFVR